MENERKGLWGLGPRRKAAGYTQEQLAAALGVSRQTLSAWESGKTSPFAAQLPEIARILGCSIGALYEAPAVTPMIPGEEEQHHAHQQQ